MKPLPLSLALIALSLPAAALADSSAAPVFRDGVSHDERSQNARLKDVFDAIDAQDWAAVEAAIERLPNGNMKSVAKAEYYLNANSPRVELGKLLTLLEDAPEIPQAEQLGRLAQKRGATILPSTPQRKRLRYVAGTGDRRKPDQVGSDGVANQLRSNILSYIKNDDPRGAEAILSGNEGALTGAGRTELQQRIAWSYYIENDDRSALALAQKAQRGSGEWVVHADWTAGLAAWRLNDCPNAQSAFAKVARAGTSREMRAAGLYWSARADARCGQPQNVQGKLQTAAQYDDSFYGLLAGERLGLAKKDAVSLASLSDGDIKRASRNPNVATAIALSRIGKADLAGEMIRHQAKIGADSDHATLLAISQELSLPNAQLYLAQYAPAAYRPTAYDRLPAPNWQPERGWRVDPALVFAHTLQESRFQSNAVSPAGAYGLMQVRPGTARDIARNKGYTIETGQLFQPAVNLEFGQSYLEMLRDMSATGGLLPKVAAAYNAGPAPVIRWNSEIRDLGDPLLYVESIPYYETREYVGVIMRNYWLYSHKMGQQPDSLTEMVQSAWPRFPQAKKNGRLFTAR